MVIVANANPLFTTPFAEELPQGAISEAGYNSPRGWGDYRLEIAKYYEAQLDATDQFLQGNNLSNDPAYRLNHVNNANILAQVQTVQPNIPLTTSLISPAFTQAKRYKIIAKLAAVLHYYALQYHVGMYELRNLPNPQANEVNDFQNGNSRAKHAVTTITQNFQDSIQLACQRILADWLEINNLFFPNRILIQLTDIEMTGSDFHKKGKQVLILKFKPKPIKNIISTFKNRVKSVIRQPKEAKLVYKPSDVELDCRLVGDTQALNNSLPGIFSLTANDNRRLPPFISLFEFINKEIAASPHILNQDGRLFRLPTYRILPRRPGSDPNHIIPPQPAPRPAPVPPPIADSYGYIEFLTHDPDWDNNGNPNQVVSGDWITGANWKLRYFYRLFGWYIGIAMVFGLADSHQGNLLVHKCKPYLIDLEISLKWRTSDIRRTGLHDVMTRGNHPYKCRLKYLTKTFFGQNQIQPTIGTEAAVYINDGIREVIGLLETKRAVFNAWLNSNQLDRTVARYTPRATPKYGERLRNVYRGVLSIIPLHPWTLQNDTVANINNLPNSNLGDAYVVTTNGNLNPGNLNVIPGDMVEFDGNNWLKRIDSPPISKEDYPTSYNNLSIIKGNTVINMNLLLPNAGDAYVVKDNGTLRLGNVNVTPGDVVEFDDNNSVWVKRSSYTMPFFDFLLEDTRTWYEAGNLLSLGRPNFATSNPAHDWECYRNCDYPAYYRRLGEMDLRNARGAVVAIAAPSINGNRAKVTATAILRGTDDSGKVTYTAEQSGIEVSHEAGNIGTAHINRALAVNVVNVAAKNSITVTFGTAMDGKSVIPTAIQVATAVNNDPNASTLVRAAAGGTGNSAVDIHAPTPLDYQFPGVAIAGNHYFDYDIDGQPAVNALQIASAQVNALNSTLPGGAAHIANLVTNARMIVSSTYDTATNIGF